jgi:hypothetical protein
MYWTFEIGLLAYHVTKEATSSGGPGEQRENHKLRRETHHRSGESLEGLRAGVRRSEKESLTVLIGVIGMQINPHRECKGTCKGTK